MGTQCVCSCKDLSIAEFRGKEPAYVCSFLPEQCVGHLKAGGRGLGLQSHKHGLDSRTKWGI